MKVTNSVVLALALGAGACLLEPHPSTSRYYTLSPEVAPAEAGRATLPSFGLGPLTLPPYLDRSEVVTRVGRDQLSYSGNDRWAAPLPELLARTLAEDLRLLLPAGEVVAWPWSRSSPPDLSASVDFLRFEAESGGSVVLVARWTLQPGGGGPALATGETRFHEPSTTEDGAASAAALSRGLAAVARDVAQAAERARSH